jgi:DNA replication initiation complex subunit (GINS family)
MDDLLDLIAADNSQSELSDRIKSILYSKAAEKIEELRPEVADSFFNGAFAEE